MNRSFIQRYLTLVFLMLTGWANASHFMGTDMTYTCLPNGCTYRIYHSTYLDCAGSATQFYLPPPNNPYPAPFVTVNGTPAGCAPALGNNWVLVSYEEVTPVCPTYQTECYVPGAAINGVVGATYYIDYNLCNTTCTSIQLVWTDCCRNYGITSGAGGDGIYSGVTTIQPGLSPCNSSPQFSVPPVPYICDGQTYTYSQGAFDPDGDSLSYSLGPCSQGAGNNVGYLAGYSATSPLGPGWNVSINSQTGDVTVIPTPGGIQTGVICVYVTEWRIINGVYTQIGQVLRDIQLTVINCNNNNNNPVAYNTGGSSAGVSNLQNGVLNGTNPINITNCQGTNLEFDFTAVDYLFGSTTNYSNDTITMTWSQNIPGLVFSNAANPAQIDTITGLSPLTAHIDWTSVAPGTYFMTIYLSDNACPLFGYNQYTLIINVVCCNVEPLITVGVSNCYTATWAVSPSCGVAPFTYQWSTSPGLPTPPPNTTNFSYTFPSTGTYYYAVTVTDALGNGSTTLDTLVIANNAVANAGPDISLCPGSTHVLGSPALSNYTYQWSSNSIFGPNVGFAGSLTSAQPTASLINTTGASVPINYTVTAIDSLGCPATDDATVTFFPTPSALFAASSPICVNDTSLIQVPTPLVGASYFWNFGPNSFSLTGNTGPGPHQVVYTTPGNPNISLQVVSAAGCSSLVNTVPILVKPLPTTTFTALSPVCAGSPSIVTYTGSAGVNDTYIWNFDNGNVISPSGGQGQGPHAVVWSQAQAGTHNLTLQVIENGCIGIASSQQVVVNEIPTANFSIPNFICPNDTNYIIYTGSSSPSAVYNWDFGDAIYVSGSGQGPYAVYWTSPSSAGPHTVCLTVIENGCVSTTNCQTVIVSDPPVAGIAPVANQCFNGNSFDFTYTGTPGATQYYWDFGVGATPANMTGVANPTGIQYLNYGPKTAWLYVTGPNGCVSDTVFVNFEVVPEPSSNFTFSTGQICLGACVNFNYTGVPVSGNQAYSWSFTNGNPANTTLVNPGCIQFNQPGWQTATLVVENFGCFDTATQQVYINDAPQINAGPDLDFCAGSGPIQINATTVGGTPTYGYVWSSVPANGGISNPYVEDPFVNPTDTVTFYVQVTDAVGCRSNIDSVVVIQKPRPQANAGANRFICDAPGAFGQFLDGSVIANGAPAPFTYSWIPAGPNNGMQFGEEIKEDPYVRPLSTTIYTLFVSSINGCTSIVTTLDTLSTTTVYVNPLPIVNAGEDRAICFGDTTLLTGFATGAGPAYTYQWTPNTPQSNVLNPTSSVSNAAPTQTTTYTLSATSNQCVGTDQVTVTVNTIPTSSIEPPVADICQGAKVTLNGSADGDPTGATYTYSWVATTGLSAPDQAVTDASPQTTTTYILYAGSENCLGVVDQITITVKPTPVADITNIDTLICGLDTVNLNVNYSFIGTPVSPNILYNWTPGSQISGATTATPKVFPDQTTVYYATVSVSGGCSTTDSVTINVAPPINASITADNETICGDTPTTLHALGGNGSASYTWSPAYNMSDSTAKDPVVSPSQTTTYSVTIQEGHCSDVATITIDVNPTPVADFYATNLMGCLDMEVSFIENATNEIAYIWNFGDGTPVSNEPNPTHTYSTPGTYSASFTAVGAGGCAATVPVGPIVVSGNTFAAFTSNPTLADTILLPNAIVNFKDASVNGVNWHWNFGDGTTSADQNPVHEFITAGDYTVTLTVTNEHGCVSEFVQTPYVVRDPGLFIPNIFTPNGDNIHDTWDIQYYGTEAYELKIYDRWGNLIFGSTTPDKDWDGNNKSGLKLQDGVYFYDLSVGKKVYNGNVTIMR